MNVLGWAVNLLGSQPAQPTGAIDVIAVRRSNGDLTCSPFHVRMNKAVKKGEKRLVKIRVNGKDVNVWMKLGQAGEAFFLERTREILREDVVDSTSFPTSPVLQAETEKDLRTTVGETAKGLSAHEDRDSKSIVVPSVSAMVLQHPTGLRPSSTASNTSSLQRSLSESNLLLNANSATNEATAVDTKATTAAEGSSSSTLPVTVPLMKRQRSNSDMSPHIASAATIAASNSVPSSAKLLQSLSGREAAVSSTGGRAAVEDDDAFSLQEASSTTETSLATSPLPAAMTMAAPILPSAATAINGSTAAATAATATTVSDEKKKKASDVSWIWRWGYLPVQSKTTAALTSTSDSVANACLGPDTAASGMSKETTTATADGPRDSSMVVAANESNGDAASLEADDKNKVVSNSPPRSVQTAAAPSSTVAAVSDADSFFLLAQQQQEMRAVPSDDLLLFQQAVREDESSSSNSGHISYHASEKTANPTKTKPKQQLQTTGATGAAASSSSLATVAATTALTLTFPTLDYRAETQTFSALSLCGHLLLASSMAAVPRTPHELLEVLYMHRVTSDTLSTSTTATGAAASIGPSLLDHPHLVVIVDDFLLSMPMMRQLLASYYSQQQLTQPHQQPGQLQVEELLRHIPAGFMVNDEMVQALLMDEEEHHAAGNGRGNGSSDRASWIGKRISTWTAPIAQAAAVERPTMTLAMTVAEPSLVAENNKPMSAETGSSVDAADGVREEVVGEGSEIAAALSNPAADTASKGDKEEGDAHSSPAPISASANTSAISFELWKSSLSGWRESFGDLMVTAYRYQQLVAIDSVRAYLTSPILVGNNGGDGQSSARGGGEGEQLTNNKAFFPADARQPEEQEEEDQEQQQVRRSSSEDDYFQRDLGDPMHHRLPTPAEEEPGLGTVEEQSDQLHDDHDSNSSLVLPALLPAASDELIGSRAAMMMDNNSSMTPPPPLTAMLSNEQLALLSSSASLAGSNPSLADTLTAEPTVIAATAVALTTASNLAAHQSHANQQHSYNSTAATTDEHEDHVSLEDVAFEDISPEPAGGDFYDSDTDSYLSFDGDDEDDEEGQDNKTAAATIEEQTKAATIAGNRRGGGGGGVLRRRHRKHSKDLSYYNTIDRTSGSYGGVEAVGGGGGGRYYRRYRYRKVLNPSKEQMEVLKEALQDGYNELEFILLDAAYGSSTVATAAATENMPTSAVATVAAAGGPIVKAQLYLWSEEAKIVAVDIEQVLLKGKGHGNVSANSSSYHHVGGAAGSSGGGGGGGGWTAFLGGGGGGASTASSNTASRAAAGHHLSHRAGQHSLFTSSQINPASLIREEAIYLLQKIQQQGYQILYFAPSSSSSSSSSYTYPAAFLPSQQQATREYLDKFFVTSSSSSSKAGGAQMKLPYGPMLKSPDTLMTSTTSNSNSIAHRSDVFKAAALRGIRSLFPAPLTSSLPYHAAFVGKMADLVAFERNKFPEGRIFLVQPSYGIYGRNHEVEIMSSHRLCVRGMSWYDFQEIVEEVFPLRPQGGGGGQATKTIAAGEHSPARVGRGSNQRLQVGEGGNKVAASSMTTRNSIGVEDTYSDFQFWRLPPPSLDDYL